MKIRFILPCVIASALAASCTPYKDGPNEDGPNRGKEHKTVADKNQQKIEEQRKQMAREDELKKTQDQPKPGETANNTPDKPVENTPPNPEPPKPPVEKAVEYPFASRVPGKDGFVFSPYNNRQIDVRGIESGKLVRDPTYQASEKKYFRVP